MNMNYPTAIRLYNIANKQGYSSKTLKGLGKWFNRISPEIPLALGGGMNGDIILEKDWLFLNYQYTFNCMLKASKTRVGTTRSSLWTSPKELDERGNPLALAGG